VKIESRLNPIDWWFQDPNIDIQSIKLTYPAVLGVDSAGVIDDVGEEVKSFEKGDRVLHSGSFTSDKSTFQEYVIVPHSLAAKIPTNISFDEAATVPLTLSTAAVGFYHSKENGRGAGLYPPWEQGGIGRYSGQPLVVFGGASSTGLYAIQLAKLSGFSPIIATASEHNTAMLKSIGATHVLSRHLSSSALESSIKEIVNGDVIQVIYDAVSIPETQQLGWDLLGNGGCLVVVLDPNFDKRGQENEKSIARVYANVHHPPNMELGTKLFGKVAEWLQDGSITPNRVEVLPNGLLGVPDGLQRMKNNSISGVKLIARVGETP